MFENQYWITYKFGFNFTSKMRFKVKVGSFFFILTQKGLILDLEIAFRNRI